METSKNKEQKEVEIIADAETVTSINSMIPSLPNTLPSVIFYVCRFLLLFML